MINLTPEELEEMQHHLAKATPGEIRKLRQILDHVAKGIEMTECEKVWFCWLEVDLETRT